MQISKNELAKALEDVFNGTTLKGENMKATYVSVFDDNIVCESSCDYDNETQTVSNINDAPNADEAENADCLTDEYVVLPDGTKLRETDGVTFDY